MAEEINQTLPAIHETGSCGRSTEGSALGRVSALPARLDDDLLAKVDAFAQSAVPAMRRTDEEHLLQLVRMMSDMPRKGDDNATAQVRLANLQRHLGDLPRQAIDWIAGQVHRRFTFYPAIKELLDLAAEWKREGEPVLARRKAARKVYDELQTRLAEARKRLRTEECGQAWIDALADGTKAILAAEGHLRRDGEAFRQTDEWRRRQEFLAQTAHKDPAAIIADIEAAFPSERDEAA